MTEATFKAYVELKNKVTMARIKLDLLDEVLSFKDPVVSMDVYPGYPDFVDKTDGIHLSSAMDKIPVELIMTGLKKYRDDIEKEMISAEEEMLAL